MPLVVDDVIARHAAGRAVELSRWATTRKVAAESRTGCRNIGLTFALAAQWWSAVEEAEEAAAPATVEEMDVVEVQVDVPDPEQEAERVPNTAHLLRPLLLNVDERDSHRQHPRASS
jgi:hypothetical protein